MARSKKEIPHYYLRTDIDLTRATAWTGWGLAGAGTWLVTLAALWSYVLGAAATVKAEVPAGGILIARDLRDNYEQLVNDAGTDPGQPATTTNVDQPANGSVLPDMVAKADLQPAPEAEVNVAVAPDMPPPADRSEPAIVDVTFEVVENVATIDPGKGTETTTWGYKLIDGPEGLVVGTPGPAVRARVGDVLRFTIVNPDGNKNPHNVDFHAVTGQGGGAEATTVAPGETRTIEARLLYPGFFM